MREYRSIYVSRNKFGHFKHANLFFTVEDGFERIICIDESSLLLILESVLLDILPELLGEFCAWEWFGANNCGEFIVWSYWLHESCIRFTLCCHIIFSFNGYDFSPYVVNIAYNTRVDLFRLPNLWAPDNFF